MEIAKMKRRSKGCKSGSMKKKRTMDIDLKWRGKSLQI
jgi:hypothetical protein